MSASISPRRRKRNTDVLPLPEGKCPSGKVRWPTRAGARMHRRHLATLGKAAKAGRLNTYRCDRCGGWHVGHKGVAYTEPEGA